LNTKSFPIQTTVQYNFNINLLQKKSNKTTWLEQKQIILCNWFQLENLQGSSLSMAILLNKSVSLPVDFRRACCLFQL